MYPNGVSGIELSLFCDENDLTYSEPGHRDVRFITSLCFPQELRKMIGISEGNKR